MKRSHIKLVGKPEKEGGLVRAHNVQIIENGEIVPRVQAFSFNLEVNGIPTMKIEQIPEFIEFDLEGVEVHKEISNTRIFNECTEIMKTMDYDFRINIEKRGLSWKTEDPVKLKEYLDTCYKSLNTIMEQYRKGERHIIDVTMFATKLANYAVLLADRTYILHLQDQESQEKKEKERNADSDKVQEPKM